MKTYGLMFTNDNPASAPAVSLAPTLTTFFQIGGTTLTPPGITKPVSTLGFYTFEWTPTLPIFFVADGGTLISDSTQRYLSGILDPLDLENERSTTLLAYSASLVALGSTNFALGTTNVALGTTNVALGTTSVALGITGIATSIMYGSTSVALGTTAIATTVAYGSTNVALGTSNLAQGSTILGYGITTYAIATSLLAQGVSINASVTLLTVIDGKIGATTSVFGDSSTDPGTIYGYLKRLQEFNEGDATFNKQTGAWTVTDRSGATTIATKTLSNNNTQVTKS